jgi:cobalt-zinc-cadmium resistance protein CzcA
VAEAQAKVTEHVRLPSGTWLTWSGQFENLIAAGDRLRLIVPACFIVIFLMLFAALGSIREARLAFSGVPLAISGGTPTLYLPGMPFSVSAAVGFIALSSIAVLNGLVLVTTINHLRLRGENGEPLATVVVGGMTTATLLTLVVVPDKRSALTDATLREITRKEREFAA